MKILIPTLEYPPQIGGIAQYIVKQIEHWPDRSDSFVVCAPIDNHTADFDKKNSWITYRLKFYFNFFWPRWLRLLWQVNKIIKKKKVDKILVHHILPVGYIAYLNKKLRQIPYYLFFHGRDLGLAFSRKPYKAKLICHQAEKIIVNSQYIKDQLLNYLPEIKDKIVVVYPCPSLSNKNTDNKKLAEIKELINPDHAPLLLTVARFVKRKGIDDSILAFKQILTEFPQAIYLIIGHGEEHIHLQALIVKNSLVNNVKIFSVSRADLPYYYQLADVFVLTPKELPEGDVEGFGMVYLEASFFGLPIVATKTGGVPEAVLNGKTGLLAESGNIEQIGQAIIKLLANKNYARQLGEQGKQRVEMEFEWGRQMRIIVDS